MCLCEFREHFEGSFSLYSQLCLRGTDFGRSTAVCSVEDQRSELTLFTDPDVTHIPTQVHSPAMECTHRHIYPADCARARSTIASQLEAKSLLVSAVSRVNNIIFYKAINV